MKFLLFLIPIWVFAYVPSDDRTIDADFIVPLNQSQVQVSSDFVVTGQTTLNTSLEGFLKATSGVVSSQALIDLTTDVTGILPIANGGTGSATQNFVDLTTNQTVSGVKTFDSQFVAVSTTNGFRPCPVMTEAQRDAIASPAEGDCVVDSTNNQLNYYLDGAWGQVGGGSELTVKGNLIGFDGVDTKECTLDATDDYVLTRDAAADCGWDFKAPAVSTTLTQKGETQGHNGTSNEAVPPPPGDNYLYVSDLTQNTGIDWYLPFANKGELFTFDGTNFTKVDAAPGDGYNLVSDSAESGNMKWSQSVTGKLNPVTDFTTPEAVADTWTNATTQARWKGNGETVTVEFLTTLTGVPAGGTPLDLTMPAGLTINIGSMLNVDILTGGRATPSGVGMKIWGIVLDANTIRVIKGQYRPQSGVSEQLEASTLSSDTVSIAGAPRPWGSGNVVRLTISEVPIVGKSSGLDAAVQNKKLATLIGAGNAGQSLTASVTDIPFIASDDNLGAWDGDSYEAPHDMKFEINGSVLTTGSTNASVFLYINGTDRTSLSSGIGSTTRKTFAGSGKVSQGDIISVRFTGAATLSNNAEQHWIQINEVPGEAVIAGTFENINSTDIRTVIAGANAGNTGITAGVTNIPFTVQGSDDLYGLWDGDEFTPDKDGFYFFDGSEVATGSSTRTIDAWVNRQGGGYANEERCTQAVNSSLQKFQCVVKLQVGDKLAFRSDLNHTQSTSGLNRVTIVQSANFEALVKNLINDQPIEGWATFDNGAGSPCSSGTCNKSGFYGVLGANMIATRTAAGLYDVDMTGLKPNKKAFCSCNADSGAGNIRFCDPMVALETDGSGNLTVPIRTRDNNPADSNSVFTIKCEVDNS